MSLDVYLVLPGRLTRLVGPRIFIRENGRQMEISREEWTARHPDMEPCQTPEIETETNEVYHRNITHNLGRMAKAAGLYEPMWRPEELHITTAEQMIEPLREALILLERHPDRFKELNPENGWGNYEGLVDFVADYLAACKAYPEAEIQVSR